MKRRTKLSLIGLTGLFFGMGLWVAPGLDAQILKRRVFRPQADLEAAAQPDPLKAGAAAKTQAGDMQEDAARQAITDNAKAFIAAFNKQDAKTLAAMFTETCEVIEHDGDEFHGRKEIEQEFAEDFKDNPNGRISLALDSLRFVTPDVAIETGKTTFFPDGKTATVETPYQVVHLKKGNQWLMDQVRTFEPEFLTPYAHLRSLEWLIGDWVDESNEFDVQTSYKWADNKAFLLQSFTVRAQGKSVMQGTQRIGWDPLAKHIKAWVFDSEGGFGESLWSEIDDSWVIKAKGVRSDGRIMTTTNEITKITADRMTYRSVDRIVGNERMDDIVVTIVRKPPTPKR